MTGRIALTAGLALALCACATPELARGPLSGRAQVYRADVPDFDLEVLADPALPGVRVNVGVPSDALTAIRAGRSGEATLSAAIRVRDASGSVAARDEWSRDWPAGPSGGYRVVSRSIAVPYGATDVQVVLRDEISGLRAERSQRIRLDSAAVGTPHVLLDGQPFVPLAVPEQSGFLGWSVPLAIGVDSIDVPWTLIRFPADREPARPPFALAGSLGSREHRGVLYERPDTVRTARARLGRGSVIPLPSMPAGVYALDLDLGEDRHFRRALIVRERGFPAMDQLSVLRDALAYIAEPSEMLALETAVPGEGLREQFDAFWARLFGSRGWAESVLRRYYSRAVEANRAFSAYKEGWRTDRGMVYMIMGPPVSRDVTADGEIWNYTLNEGDESRRFVFERVGGHGDGLELAHYVLERSVQLEREWRRAVDRWRSGQ